MSLTALNAIADGLFTDEAQPRLIGGRDRVTARVVFPCPDGEEWAPLSLGRDGTLWSWTVQRYRPKSPPYTGPEAFTPWIVAYIELPETIVEARLIDIDPADVKIGLPVTLSATPLDPAKPGERMIPAFRPVSA